MTEGSAVREGLTEMLSLPGGPFTMGSEDFYPEEGPAHRRTVGAFDIDLHPVTTAQFADFVEQTGYLTTAEQALDPAQFPGLAPDELAPGALSFTPAAGPVDLRNWRQWWRWQPGASWRAPQGPDGGFGTATDRATHPVVQVSFLDAQAYAAWAGKELPTEVELEYAAGGGVDAAPYAWGDQAKPGGRLMANTWQGRFPFENVGADGWVGTSPVMSFAANGFGLFDLIGNTWEWTTSAYTLRQDVPAHPCCGPSRTSGLDPGIADPERRRVLKGGSHLCAPEYCLRYRPAARSPQSDDTSTTHIGFRCILRATSKV